MEITNNNYHSVETRMEYMGSSQFKDFMKCEACALARCKGEMDEKKSDSLMMGSYYDAWFSNELDQFKQDTPELFNNKGELYAKYKKVEEIIDFVKNDPMLMKYLGGQHQVIMTGTIGGVLFKIKIDSYFPDVAIVDGKLMKDMSPVWVDGKGWLNFAEAYGYDIQGAIYQEIERQWVLKHTGNDRKIPFILAVATKEDVPDKALLEIDQEQLDKCLKIVEELAPRFDGIKKGKIRPKSCSKCDYCKSTKKVTGIFTYHMCDKYVE